MSNKSLSIFLNSQSFPHQSTMSDDTFIYVWIYFCSISFHLYSYLYTFYLWYLWILIFGKGNHPTFFFSGLFFAGCWGRRSIFVIVGGCPPTDLGFSPTAIRVLPPCLPLSSVTLVWAHPSRRQEIVPTGRADFVSVGECGILFSSDLFWFLMIPVLMC